MIVVADTSPLNYLVLIGEQELLPTLFGRIVIPEAVFQELRATVTPQTVQKWLAQAPDWLEIRKTAGTKEAAKRRLSTSGTLGVLDRAAEKGLVDFSKALQRIKQTSFYLSPPVERFFLERDTKRKARKKIGR